MKLAVLLRDIHFWIFFPILFFPANVVGAKIYFRQNVATLKRKSLTSSDLPPGGDCLLGGPWVLPEHPVQAHAGVAVAVVAVAAVALAVAVSVGEDPDRLWEDGNLGANPGAVLPVGQLTPGPRSWKKQREKQEKLETMK